MATDYGQGLLKILGARRNVAKQPEVKTSTPIIESVNNEINIDSLPGIQRDAPEYEMHKVLLTSILKRNPALLHRMKNWD